MVPVALRDGVRNGTALRHNGRAMSHEAGRTGARNSVASIPLVRTDHGPLSRDLLNRLEDRREWRTLLDLTATVEGGRPASLALRRSFYREQLDRETADGRADHGRAASPDATLRTIDTNAEGGRTILLVNDTDGRVNIGCRLTSRALKEAVRAALPDDRVASLPFTFRRAYPETGAVRAGGDVLGDAAALAQLAAGYGPGALEALDAADVVLFQPEGTIDARIAPARLETLLLPLIVARALGKRAAVINGTIPDFADARAQTVRAALSVAGSVTFRDSVSAAIWGGGFLADCAFTTRVAQRADGSGDGCLISTGARNDGAKDRAIVEAALGICDRHGLRPLALTKKCKAFLPFRREIERRGGVLAETASVAEALRLAAGCRLHVGGRYHMTILAAIAGVPTFLFNVRTQKNEWLSSFVPLVELVPYGAEFPPAAVERRMGSGGSLPFVPALRVDYVAAIRAAGAA